MSDGPLRIVLGADHRGASQAQRLCEHLQRAGHEASIIGQCDGPCDYPDQAYVVGQAIRNGEADFGILICGTSIGMSIAANKIDGVRAAVVHDELTAGLSRAHNDANVLCLSGDLLGQHLIERITDAWLASPFEGGRHERRTRKIEAIERGEDPRNIS
ncbi:MAG: ribose 5-phosphate isomerase B [Phycisphaerales bacterium JB059]